jgi:cell division protein FtsQ
MKVNRVKKKSKRTITFGTVRNVAGLVFIFAIAIIIYVYLYRHPVKPVFSVNHVALMGNRHLADDELRALAGVRLNESMFAVSGKEVSRQVLKSPWVRSVSLRREFPDTVSITIKEAEPFALLDKDGHLFLIDEKGKLLEELKDNTVPFLPVIESDPFKEKEGFSEALNLVKFMNTKGFSSERDRIEVIAHRPHDLSVRVDETVVKIGTGGYEEKIERLVQLEEEIKKMGLSVDYIDLRFADKAIVKPVKNEAVK